MSSSSSSVPASVPAAHEPLAIWSPALVGALLAGFELLVLVLGGGEDLAASDVVVMVALCTAVVGAHGAFVVAADVILVERGADRARARLWLLAAAAFGAGWQDTMMHGDGIQAADHYLAIRVGSALVAPAGLEAWALLVGPASPLSPVLRRALAFAVGLAGAVATQTLLTDYDAMHGYLALFVAANVTLALWPLLARRSAGASGALVLGASILAVVVIPSFSDGQRSAQALTAVPAALLSLPWTAPLQEPAEPTLDVASVLSGRADRALRAELALLRDELGAAPRGDSVLLIVLESTRADSWANEEVAPQFADWRKAGLFVPRAVAQYPATPLAYGALFTAQPPSVLTQTPQWARSRLFDELAPRFDHLLLSRPLSKWLDRGAITDFFVPRDVSLMEHNNTEVGLPALRDRLEALDPEASFFAWAHLYEPHKPWKWRKRFSDAETWSRRVAYESEVTWVDDSLGAFMTWFLAQPKAASTLVIVIADHGEGMGERIEGKPFWGHHVHVHTSVSHVPAFFAGPGLPKDEVRSLPVGQLDVMPTVFDFLGAPLPPGALPQGRSLYATLEDPAPRDLVTEAFSIRGAAFFELIEQVRTRDIEAVRERFAKVSTSGTYAPKIALQRGRYKISRNLLLKRSRLFDVDADPDERHDLSAEEPELFARLQQRLDAWRAKQAWVVRELEGR